jgi:hypothetical protein
MQFWDCRITVKGRFRPITILFVDFFAFFGHFATIVICWEPLEAAISAQRLVASRTVVLETKGEL